MTSADDISICFNEGDIHGNALFNKMTSTNHKDLKRAYKYYQKFREKMNTLKILGRSGVKAYVDATNEYRENVVYIFENRKNSGQEGLRSSIMEEFLSHLFKDLVNTKLNDVMDNVVLGKGNTYVSLSFTPRSFKDLYKEPHPYIHTKDQDFVLGCNTVLCVSPVGDKTATEGSKFVIPVLAIECKTYLERNMMDSCASTARRLKSGMPYCLYIVVSEYLKMDHAYPELTDIDEVYILCKAKNSDRLRLKKEKKSPHPLDSDLVLDLFTMVKKHINRLWWAPEEALKSGKIIRRP